MPVKICAMCAGLLLFAFFSPLSVRSQEIETNTPLVSRTLPNGLEVIVYPDSAVPLVTVEFVVRLGSQFETAEDSGLAHLYEHLFFKTNRAVEQAADYLKDIDTKGIAYNGNTREELSSFYFTAVKAELPVLMRFARDAALHPSFKEGEIQNEKETVLAELAKMESNLYPGLNRKLVELLFPGNPAAKNSSGTSSVVRAASPEKLRALHRRFVVPENSALVVCGDCAPANVFRLAEDLFAEWPRGASGTAVPAAHPPLEKSAAAVLYSADTERVTVQIGWQGPSVTTDTGATYAADVLSFILTQPGGRFQRALVDSGLMHAITVGYLTQRNVGTISFVFAASPDRSREAVRALKAQLATLTSPEYFTDEELASAKTLLAADELFSREKPTEYVHSIAFWWAVSGTPYLLGYQQALRGTGRADIARYLQRYLAKKPFAAVALMPESVREANLLSMEDLLKP